MARPVNKAVAGQGGRGQKNVAGAFDHRATESRVKVEALHHLPGETLMAFLVALGKKPVGQRYNRRLGRGQDVGFVEPDEPPEIAKRRKMPK